MPSDTTLSGLGVLIVSPGDIFASIRQEMESYLARGSDSHNLPLHILRPFPQTHHQRWLVPQETERCLSQPIELLISSFEIELEVQLRHNESHLAEGHA